MTWWWLSFAGPHFLGCATVQGADEMSAILHARALGIDPGGDVMALESPTEYGDPPAQYANRLLNAEESDLLSMIWTGSRLRSTLDYDLEN